MCWLLWSTLILLWKWRWIIHKVSFGSTIDAVFWVSFILAFKLSKEMMQYFVPLINRASGWWVHDLVLLSLWGSPLTPSRLARSWAWINPVEVSLKSTFALSFWGLLSLSQFLVGFALNCLNFWVVLAMYGFFLPDPYFHLFAELVLSFLSEVTFALQLPIALLFLEYRCISLRFIE